MSMRLVSATLLAVLLMVATGGSVVRSSTGLTSVARTARVGEGAKPARGVLPTADGLVAGQGGAADCNGNGVPDVCDLDCDAPGESCLDLASCGTETDCNVNSLPDSCDLVGQTSNIFATGMAVPEDIVPSQGDYPPGFLITDATNDAVYLVSPDGREVTVFAVGLETPVGAVIVPDAFGGLGDRLLVANFNQDTPSVVDLLEVSSAGVVTPFAELPVDVVTGLAYIPIFGGQELVWRLLVTSQIDVDGVYVGSVYLVDAAGEITELIPSFGAKIFTPTLCPTGFGNFGNLVFVGETDSADVYYLSTSSGQRTLFATLPKVPGSEGVRQIAFSPVGWFATLDPTLDGETVMVVSVASSRLGGGESGAVLAVDSTGQLRAMITEETGGGSLDPRGLTFTGSELLISNAADGSVLSVSAEHFAIPDCNGNSILDACDITDSTSSDCDGNGLPDDCDPDCNDNTIADACDIADETSPDCNLNRVPDECDLDCNGNGVPDSCDLANHTSADRNNNLVPDECEVLYVDAAADGVGNGSSWSDAFDNLKEALVAVHASGGIINTVWVATGTYVPLKAGDPLTRNATFALSENVAIYGGFPSGGGDGSFSARNPRANETILSGDLAGNDPTSSCCTAHDTPGCDDTTCADDVCSFNTTCCALDPWSEACADLAALLCSEACGGNNSENSYHVVTGDAGTVTSILDGFTITGGNADGPPGDDVGGGIHNDGGSPSFVDCVVDRNVAASGGGMANLDGAAPLLVNCVFSGNEASSDGGAVYNAQSQPDLIGCLFTGNTASTGRGGALYNSANTPTLINCTLVGNSAGTDAGGVYNDLGCTPTLTNCILWANTDSGPRDESAQIDTMPGFPGAARVTFNLIEGLDALGASPGNIGEAPQFVDAAGVDGVPGTRDDNLRLAAGSAGIDAGNTTALPPDAVDLDDDGHKDEPLPLDLDRTPRVTDDPTAADTGIAVFDIVDMGAFELLPSQPSNDVCSLCSPIVTGDPVEGTTVGASGSDVTTCANDDSVDVWFCWTADCSGEATIDLCDSAYDTALAVFDQCGGLELACDDDGCFSDVTSAVTVPVVSGSTYRIRVSGANGDIGHFTLDVPSCVPMRACCLPDGACALMESSACLAADGISGGPTSTCDGDLDGNSVDDACEALFGACCVDDACSDELSLSTCDAMGGLWGGGETECASYTCPPMPSDSCSAAFPIAGEGVFPFDNTQATTDGLVVASCSPSSDAQIEGDMWYCWTAPSTGEVFARTCGLTDVDTMIAIYEGCSQCPPTEAVMMTCNDDRCGEDPTPGQSMALFFAEQDQAYLIRVGHTVDGSPGTGSLDITYGPPDHPACPGVGDCCAANGNGTPSCTEESCCDTVCACDPYCCEVDWDAQCATTGAGVNGCGAQVLCTDICVEPVGVCCHSGEVCESEVTRQTCLDSGGLWDGSGATCEESCAARACCQVDGTCEYLNAPDCASNNGILNSFGTTCTGDADGNGADDVCQIVYVDADVLHTAWDGSSWEHAFRDLQPALTYVRSTGRTITEVWVAQGRYTPFAYSPQTRSASQSSFELIDGVAIYGGFMGEEIDLHQRDPVAYPTTLTGDINGDDPSSACCLPGIGPACDDPVCEQAVCGIDSTCCTAAWTQSCAELASALCLACNGQRSDNSDHVVTAAGADSTAILDGFTIRDGYADGDPPDDRGAGMYISGNPTVARCVFTQNFADRGGGLYGAAGSAPNIVNSMFRGNLATMGGAMHLDDGNAAVIANSVLTGNRSLFSGGGVFNAGGSPTITNCTLVQNLAGVVGGGVVSTSGSPSLKNCILWSNADSGGSDEGAQIHVTAGELTASFSTIQGLDSITGLGNVGVSPGFVDPRGADNIPGTADDDLHLQPGSAAIDAGDTTALPADVADLDGNRDLLERIPFDLDSRARVVDDPFSVDTGISDFGPVDRGAYEYGSDCNGNGVPDDCDLSCGSPGGVCDSYGECGQSMDCNGNGSPDECDLDCDGNALPDECDLAMCMPASLDFPGCDDCNLNALLDRCEADDVPSECVEGTGAAGHWSDPTNWLLTGGFPDNASGDPFSVTLRGSSSDLTLDVDVELNSLRLLGGAQLRLTQEGQQGNLTLTRPGGLLNKGTILMGSDHTLIAENSRVTLADGGRYLADPQAQGPVSASLSTGDLVLMPTYPCQPDQMTLTDAMSVSVSGDLIMDGRGAMPCPFMGGSVSSGSVAGGRTPPTLRVRSVRPLSVKGDFSLRGSAAACVGCTGDGSEPTATVELAGDLDNQSTLPSRFDWIHGALRMNGTGPQTFEVAGVDLGATIEGFNTDVDTMADTDPHSNFSIGRLEVAAGRTITFVNEYANTVGTDPCLEALYVRDLVLEDGSILTFDNCRVYYQTLEQGENVTIAANGCGDLVPLCQQTWPVIQPDTMTRNRYLSFAGDNPGQETAVRVRFSDLPGAFGVLNGQSMWVGPPSAVTELSGQNDATPPTFTAATLQCNPYYTDWSSWGVIHVSHANIVPGGRYEFRVLANSCLGNAASDYSIPSEHTMSRWGDISGEFSEGVWTQPDGVVDASVDVVALLDKFAGLPGALSKTRADLEPSTPDRIISIADAICVLDAFRGLAYPNVPEMTPPICSCLAGADCDEDGFCQPDDNCPTVWSSDQADSDGDGFGDACDATFDNDHDGDIDAVDLQTFVSCFSGADGTASDSCISGNDTDSDGDVDAADFAALQRAYTAALSSPCDP